MGSVNWYIYIHSDYYNFNGRDINYYENAISKYGEGS